VKGAAAPPAVSLADLPDETDLRVTLDRTIPHRRWLYSTYLIRGEVTVSASPGGGGKTALANAISVEVATGVDLLHNHIFGSDLRVLYVSREEDSNELERRFAALDLAYPTEQLREKLGRLLRLGTDSPLTQRLSFTQNSSGGGAVVLDANGFKTLEAIIEKYRPDLLVLDPLVMFCPGDMNSPTLMGQVIGGLKILAGRFNCAILVIHHTNKSGEAGDIRSVSGAKAITDLSRRTFLPVKMSEEEAPKLGILPSEAWRHFRLVDAKQNQTPPLDKSTWYKLVSVDLPNAEPPIYPNGDSVQAVQRVYLPLANVESEAVGGLATKHALLDLIERGKIIDGQSYPYSPSIAGARNERSLLEDAIAVVRDAIVPRTLEPIDLEAVTKRTLDAMLHDEWLVAAPINELMEKPGRRFRNGRGLKVVWEKTPWPKQSAADIDSAGSDTEAAGDT
jgi:hypothetical protein